MLGIGVGVKDVAADSLEVSPSETCLPAAGPCHFVWKSLICLAVSLTPLLVSRKSGTRFCSASFRCSKGVSYGMPGTDVVQLDLD